MIDDLNNDPFDMGGDSWKGEPDTSLAAQVSALATDMLKQRVEEVETRIHKLLVAGVPMNRLHLQENTNCQCHGSGVVIGQTPSGGIVGRTCDQCLGVALIIDKRTAP